MTELIMVILAGLCSLCINLLALLFLVIVFLFILYTIISKVDPNTDILFKRKLLFIIIAACFVLAGLDYLWTTPGGLFFNFVVHDILAISVS